MRMTRERDKRTEKKTVVISDHKKAVTNCV